MNPVTDKLILFDGVCNLCNASVQFVIRHDRAKRYKFASLQSELAKHVLASFPTPKKEMNSLVLIEQHRIFYRSSAVLRVLRSLGGGWAIFYTLVIIPPFLRDAVYDMVARYRYRWFGKREACWVPTEDLRERFPDSLDEAR